LSKRVCDMCVESVYGRPRPSWEYDGYWGCPWNARDSRLNMLTERDEIPERCRMKLEQLMACQEAKSAEA
jgi:hypothetical protein